MSSVPETLTILKRAYSLLSDKNLWTAGRIARTQTDFPTEWDSPEAVKWCASGALWKAASEVGVDPSGISEPWDQLRSRLGRTITDVNDGLGGYDKIMAGLRLTIEEMEKKSNPNLPDRDEVMA